MPKPIADEYQMRIEKLKQLRAAGIDPYPDRFEKKHSVAAVLSSAVGSKNIATAGRLLAIRTMGKICFCHLLDATGRLQLVVKSDAIGSEAFKQFLKLFDSGDFAGVTGEVFKTNKGELSLLVDRLQLLGKALRPLPEKWHGLKDQELRYRQRYLDLIANPETYQRFLFRSQLIRTLREFYWQEGFTEVETPTLTHSATGATATPYQAHNAALDIDLYLRISHELPLKELIVGGFEKIFELGKAFRNEGFDPSHLPEHTHLEHYAAFWNFKDNITFTEKMFNYLFEQLGLDTKMKLLGRDGKTHSLDWQTPWQRATFGDVIQKACGIDVIRYTDRAALLKDIKAKHLSFEGMDGMSLAGLVDNLFKKVARPKIINPTILTHFPKYLQPLARSSDQQAGIVDQFQLVVNGWEIIKAYSELVDSIDQKQRFDEQKAAKKSGEADVMEGDADFITALEHGAPPISGWGMGVDRLVALLTKQDNLPDAVLFPLLKPENK